VPNANTCTASAANPVWSAELRHTQNAAGLGVRAKASARVDLGADIAYSDLTDEMQTSAITPVVALPVLPDINTKLTSVTLFAKYALARNTGIRAQYVYDRYKTDDWTWNNWVYSDGTRVTEEPKQQVHFLGLAYYYRF
jgi:predicted porin